MIKIRIYLVLLTVILHSHLWAAPYFATPSGAGSKSGDSWGNAMDTGEFSLKLISASPGDVFYLSEGIYIPVLDKNGTTPLIAGEKTFRLLPGVEVYGSYRTGLTGTANAESDRKLKNASGELSPSSIFDGKGVSFIIIDAQNTGTEEITLNGINITGASTSAIYVEKSGLKLEYCKVQDNTLASESYVGSVNGAAIYLKDATCTISNSEISGNQLNGGGMGTSAPVWVEDGVLNIANSLIADNESTNGGAPAILLENSTGNIINSTISGNESDNPALGAVTVGNNSHLNIISSTLTDNSAGVALQHEDDATLKLDNTIVSGNGKDLVLYEVDFGTAIPDDAGMSDGDILSIVSGSDTPDYSIVGSDFYDGSTVGTDVGFDASTHLGPLKYNGGNTKTHALLDADHNPAFQTGNPAYAGTSGRSDGLEKDQRGEIRLTPPCTGAYDGKEVLVLQIKIFLQGPLQDNGMMTNYIQVPNATYSAFFAPKLPVENPYGVKDLRGATVSCPGINSVPEVGEVVDWIRVDVRSVSNPATPMESRALLLRPDGSIVDTDGYPPFFDVQDEPVYLLVSHRNHLSVVSTEKNLTGDVVEHDFTTGLTQAFKYAGYDPPPMVEQNGVWCLWAGDFNGDGAIENEDFSAMIGFFLSGDYDGYLTADLNMDGMVENEDYSLLVANFLKGLYSAIVFF